MRASSLPLSVRLQLLTVGPALLGGVCGFLLDLRPGAYWVGSAGAAVGGVLAGMESAAWRAGAWQGLVRGTCFGIGLVAASAGAGLSPRAASPSPIGLLVPLSAVFGGVLGLAGSHARAWLERRRTR